MNIELQKLEAEVQQKLGRNLILLQKIELFLKQFSLFNSEISGDIKEFKTIFEQRAINMRKQTMGQVVNNIFTYIDCDFEEIAQHELKENSIHISIKLKFKYIDELSYKKQKELYKWIVAERNKLVHTFIVRDLSSLEGCNSAIQYLDEIYNKIESEFQNLQKLVEFLRHEWTDALNFMASEEGQNMLIKSSLMQMIVDLLYNTVINKARSDGWTLLSIGVSSIKEQAPEELKLLKKKYGYKKIKSFMLATNLFDFYEESTDKGGKRLLYRMKLD